MSSVDNCIDILFFLTKFEGNNLAIDAGCSCSGRWFDKVGAEIRVLYKKGVGQKT